MSMVFGPSTSSFLAETNALIRALGPLTTRPGIVNHSKVNADGYKKTTDKKKDSEFEKSVIGMAYWADKYGNGDGKLTLDELDDARFDMISFANSGVTYQKERYARLKTMIKHFDTIDSNGSGTITGKELAAYFHISIKGTFLDA